MSDFTGFPKATFEFLKGLSKNNSKKWFDAHRADYEAYILEPSFTFVMALGEKLRTISPGLVVEPRINGSVKRLNRDIRFSNDKSPYKDHLDIHFREGAGKGCGHSAYFFRLKHDSIALGAGAYGFPKEALAAFRDAVVDESAGLELEKIATKLRKAGFEIGGKHYKRLPAGYEIEGPRAEFLLHDTLYGAKSMAIPQEAHSGKFLAFCFNEYKKLSPLHDWLLELSHSMA